MELEVAIRRLDQNVPLPEYKTSGAVGFDIALVEDGTIEPGERKMFRTGLGFSVPHGYALIIAPRSSNAKKGLPMANCIGLIDPDFCGPTDELRVVLHNIGDAPYIVEKYERLAQGMFVPILHAKFVETLATGQIRGGFGSTG